jgi:fatty-acyl-CoA synthase
VEAVAVQLDAVANCAVVGVADRRWGEVGSAYVQVRAGATLTEAELRAHLEANLARYKVPRYIAFLPELPRNATGKIRRVELRHRAGADHGPAGEQPVGEHPISEHSSEQAAAASRSEGVS